MKRCPAGHLFFIHIYIWAQEKLCQNFNFLMFKNSKNMHKHFVGRNFCNRSVNFLNNF